MTYNNYSLSLSKGKFYLKSKTPQQGYEEVTYGVNNKKKTYHKYFDKIEGVPSYFTVTEVNHDGNTLRFLELSLKDGDDINKISVNLKNKGGYTDETKAFVSALNGLELNERVSITPYSKTTIGKNGKDYKNLSIFINYLERTDSDGKNPSTGYIHFNDIPKPTSKTVAGDLVWDWTTQTEFYYEKINEIEQRFKTAGEKTTPKPKVNEHKPPFPTVNEEDLKEEDYDDLPF